MFDNEQDRVHVDEGWLIYLPNCPHDTPVAPYWMQFVGIGKFAENIIWKDDDPGTHQFILLDEDMEILAVNIKEPVNDDGAPVEDVIQFAKEHLDDETVHDLVEYCSSIRSTFNLNNEMSQQDFVKILSSDMSEEEMGEAFEGFDNVIFLGSDEDED